MTGRSDGQLLLEAIEAANLFVLPLDDSRRWWRYHHLFADLLRARLQQLAPDRVAYLHRAAATWHEHHALPDDAIRHALAAGDADWAARIVEAHLENQILRRSEGATMVRWMAAVPAAALQRRPRLALGQAVVALLRARIDQVEPLLTLAEQAYAASGGEPYAASVDRSVSVLANLPATLATCRADLARLRGDGQTERAHAQAALTHMRPDDALLASVARYHLAVGDWLAGRLDAAEKGLLDVASEHPLSAERHIVLRATYDLGGVQQAQGRLGAALRTYSRCPGSSSH